MAVLRRQTLFAFHSISQKIGQQSTNFQGNIWPYWEYRASFMLANNLLLYACCIACTPESLQLRKIHQGHQGIQLSRARAQAAVWWLKISSQRWYRRSWNSLAQHYRVSSHLFLPSLKFQKSSKVTMACNTAPKILKTVKQYGFQHTTHQQPALSLGKWLRRKNSQDIAKASQVIPL